MGSDNLFHKKKAKTRDLARKQASRRRYDKVLVVCEGSKTEPAYFTEIKDYYEIDTANIKISGDCGSAPISVVNHAIELFKKESKECGEPFDRVFCVFDRDQHESYIQAINIIDQQRPAKVFSAITSTPSFELWFLLHFRYSASPIMANGGKSAGDRVIEELLRYWPDYRKGAVGAFAHLMEKLDLATRLALQLHNESKSTGCDNPLTSVHELVKYLKNMKQ